jgi:hypothetical protein
MLGVSSYSKDYVNACRAQVTAQLASHRKASAVKPADIEAFERQFLGHTILVLDHFARLAAALFRDREELHLRGLPCPILQPRSPSSSNA